jgi:2-methylcitrate dehydratase PrpD
MVTEQRGRFVTKTNLADIPPAVIARAKVSLLHDFAMTMAGRRVETIGHVIARRLWSAPSQATMLWDGSKIALEGAAFANAALMHARSLDDTHPGSTSHPGAAIIPAVLAVAEARGQTGAEFLTACILGYEIISRVGRPVAGAVTPRGYRPAMLFGGFGAAAAAKLLGLDGSKIADALGFAAHLAGGLGQVWQKGSPEWPLQLGFAAHKGITAALAAELGAGQSVRYSKDRWGSTMRSPARSTWRGRSRTGWVTIGKSRRRPSSLIRCAPSCKGRSAPSSRSRRSIA